MGYSDKAAQADTKGPLTICQTSRHYVNQDGVTGWVISFYLAKGNVLVGNEHILSETGDILDYDTENGYSKR